MAEKMPYENFIPVITLMFLGRPCSSKNTWNLEKKKHDDFDSLGSLQAY